MRTFQKVVSLIGAVLLGALLWKMDLVKVGRLVFQVGWGMVLIMTQETVAHLLNALGWRFAFTADRAASFPLLELIRLRIAGDAINYLTPSATIAGEVARTTMLNKSHGTEVRAASVLVAKFAQTVGQILFIVMGLAFVVGGHVLQARRYEVLVYGVTGSLALLLTGGALYEFWTRHHPDRAAEAPRTRVGVPAFVGWLRYFFRMHPARFGISTCLFLLAYAWGTFEAYWICHFLGVPVSIRIAMAIEVLSVTIDSLLFMVPAKMGTQEGGKTAIFAGLGLSPSAGLAFGIVRHVREVAWAGFGLLLGSAYETADLAQARPSRG